MTFNDQYPSRPERPIRMAKSIVKESNGSGASAVCFSGVIDLLLKHACSKHLDAVRPQSRIGPVWGSLTSVHTAAIGVTLMAFCASSVNAEQPPREGCRAASKIEYNSAKEKHLLRNRFGLYVRTGRVWRRYYWYCHR
jgi:hypothetical protein